MRVLKLSGFGVGGIEGWWEFDLCIIGGDPPTPNWEWGGSSILLELHTVSAFGNSIPEN